MTVQHPPAASPAASAGQTAGQAADAYRVTGTSPTRRAPYGTCIPTAAVHRRRSYDSVHVLGVGAVGCALLDRLAADRRRVIAVTDSTATIHDTCGLDAGAITSWKRAGRTLRELPSARFLPGASAIAHVDADIVADATSTDLARADWTAALGAALARGVCIASAAKAALCDAGAEWLTSDHRARVGCNAVLGGTGRSFIAELPELRQRTRAIAIVGNASTTTMIDAIERGLTLEEGIDDARRLGFLEPDAELDLRGADAAVKLAIVAGIVTGRRIDPRTIVAEDIRSLDVHTIRARPRRNATTRLIGRLSDRGELHVGYEEVSRDSILAAPCSRVVYEYRLTRDERRLHIGSSLGSAATAGALFADIRALAGEAAAYATVEAAR